MNLAGVDIILRLKERLDELDSIIEELRENTKTPSQKELKESSYEIILFKK